MSAPALSLASIRQPAFLYGPGGTIAEANDLAEVLAGRPLAGSTLAAAVGIFDVRSPDGTPLTVAEMPASRALAGEEAVDTPLVVTAADGRIVHVLATASAIRDGDEVAGALVIWQDVSALETAVAEQVRLLSKFAHQGEELQSQNEELRATEEELRQSNAELLEAQHRLRESEEKYRSIAELSPDGIVVHRGGTILYVNAAAARILRPKAPGTLIGTNILDLVHPDDRSKGGSRIDEVQQRGRITPLWEFRFLIDGEIVDADATAGQVSWEGAPAVQVTIRDITLRKRTEAALRESERQYRELVDSANSAIVRWRRDGTLTFVNTYAETLFGYGPGELIGKSVSVLVPQEDSTGADLTSLVRDVVAQPESRATNVNENVRSDGSRFWMIWTNRAIFDEAGEVAEILAIGTDITEQRRAQDARREAEAHLARAQEIAHVGSWTWDVPGNLLVWSDEAYRILGLQPGEIATPRNEDFLAFVHPDDRARVARVVQDALVKGDYDVEFRFLRKDGGEGYAHSQAAVTFADGAPVRMEGTVQDITERREAEDELRETRDYLDSLINYANAPIIVWRPDLRITRFNAAFEHMSGYAADEVIGRDLSILFPEESRDASLAKIQRTITEQWQSVEIPILRPDGGVRIALWNSANIYDKDGATLLATIAQGQDITERKEAEEALRINAENLQRSNEDLERFAYVSSHDLQEPLRAIVSFSQLLERRYGGQLDQDADDYIEFIVEGGIRMQALIQDLLAYSRVNTTKQMMTQTDTADVLASVERSIDVQLREAGAVITHDPMPVVLADPTQLAQVLMNLISNAIKFRKADVPLRIHIGARRLDGFWEFSVQDNGIGIEEEYFDRIFVIFQRLHTKDVYPGTGIGLAIVKRIIDRHGGTIRVESTPGEGSTFFFTLPAA